MWFCKGTISNRRKRGAAHVGSSWFEQLKLFQSIHPYTRVAGACLVLQTLTFERGFYYQTWGGGSSANLSLMVHVWFPICWTPCLEGFLQTFSVLCLLVVHSELGSDMKIWARALRRGKAKNPPIFPSFLGTWPPTWAGPLTQRAAGFGTRWNRQRWSVSMRMAETLAAKCLVMFDVNPRIRMHVLLGNVFFFNEQGHRLSRWQGG